MNMGTTEHRRFVRHGTSVQRKTGKSPDASDARRADDGQGSTVSEGGNGLPCHVPPRTGPPRSADARGGPQTPGAVVAPMCVHAKPGRGKHVVKGARRPKHDVSRRSRVVRDRTDVRVRNGGSPAPLDAPASGFDRGPGRAAA